MIHGIGIDIVNIPRFNRIIKRWGDRFIQRVFTPEEVFLSKNRRKSEEFLAGRFAAKEAFIKAMGGRYDFSWKDVEVRRSRRGKPLLKFNSTRFLKENRKVNAHISIAHDGEYAVAYCILEDRYEDR